MIKDPKAKIVEKKSWGRYHLIALSSARISEEAKPGQFIMVRISPHSVPLLRRPFSIHDIEGPSIVVFFQETGCGTEMLAQKKVDDSMDIIGPLGKGFNLGDGLKEKQAAVLGGGRGIAPLYFLAEKLRSAGAVPRIFYGGRSRADLPLKEKFRESGFDVHVSTDDGSLGLKGLVTDLFLKDLETAQPDRIYACGPEPMLEMISRISAKKDIPAELSLESMMGCGFGACWGCVKRIQRTGKTEWLKICEEGPVFRADEIVWDKEHYG